ncbi:helix-turn-helix transcriptional regulator [Paenibacillus sp. HN-1]|uniref:winged helix-turn-helix transcriptional regulator n=1 Tax=Paenibacillus TaxID=44249 RepID=UPI001CA80971|nr:MULTISPECIES: helix-turn-helix domain-containing protein [Paenibacillus]MBY9080210.1 helix-turn-helix transcriptional regulator [Paenibacillus sp. CGMCC 1.18879]MBY9083131.1 helix-turn-helix transcriptional regulator [Paenibacillus sinensis]
MEADNTVNVKPFAYAMSLIEGKWNMHILFWLWKREVLRYGELKRVLGNVTHKMLSNQLKQLECNNLIVRKEYPQVPPKVEYSLSPKGLNLMPVLQALCTWGEEHSLDHE